MMTSYNGNIFHVTGPLHYRDVIMAAMVSQITSLAIVYSTVYSGADQRKHQSSASLAFVRGIHQRPVNSPHKRPVSQKMLPFDDVIPRDVIMVREIHQSLIYCPHKGQWRRALMFSLTCARINGRACNRYIGDLRCHHAHYDDIVMIFVMVAFIDLKNLKRTWYNCACCIKQFSFGYFILLPEASFGLKVLSLPPSRAPSVTEFVRTITHHPFKLVRIIKFGP